MLFGKIFVIEKPFRTGPHNVPLIFQNGLEELEQAAASFIFIEMLCSKPLSYLSYPISQ